MSKSKPKPGKAAMECWAIVSDGRLEDMLYSTRDEAFKLLERDYGERVVHLREVKHDTVAVPRKIVDALVSARLQERADILWVKVIELAEAVKGGAE